MKPLLLVFIILLSHHALAADKISQGSLAPYGGVLLTDEEFIDAANAKKNLRLSDLKISRLETLNELQDARHRVYQEELSKVNSRANIAEFKTGIGMVLAFTLGAVITGFVTKETLR